MNAKIWKPPQHVAVNSAGTQLLNRISALGNRCTEDLSCGGTTAPVPARKCEGVFRPFRERRGGRKLARARTYERSASSVRARRIAGFLVEFHSLRREFSLQDGNQFQIFLAGRADEFESVGYVVFEKDFIISGRLALHQTHARGFVLGPFPNREAFFRSLSSGVQCLLRDIANREADRRGRS